MSTPSTPNSSNKAEPRKHFYQEIKNIKYLVGDVEQDIFNLLQLKKDNAKERVLNIKEAKRIADNSLMNIMDIRMKHRNTQIKLTKLKEYLDRKRQHKDEKNLDLQSLLYEKDHLLSLIHNCKEFQTPNLDQIKVIKEEIKTADLSDPIKHAEIIKKLEEELEMRKRLKNDLEAASTLTEEKQMQLAAIDKTLRAIPKLFEVVQNTFTPLIDYFHLNFQPQRDALNEGMGLPIALYGIYSKMIEYLNCQSILNRDRITMKIIGDEHLATHFYRKYPKSCMMFNSQYMRIQAQNKYEDDLDEINIVEKEDDLENKMRKKKHQKKKDNRYNKEMSELVEMNAQLFAENKFGKKIEEFPLKLVITLNQRENYKDEEVLDICPEKIYPITIEISLIPELEVLCCKAESENQLLGTRELLYNLYYDDIGQTAMEKIRKYTGLNWTSVTKRPFSWVHFLAGFTNFGTGGNKDPQHIIDPESYYYIPNNVTISEVIDKIYTRIRGISIMTYMINYLKVNKQIPIVIRANNYKKISIKMIDQMAHEGVRSGERSSRVNSMKVLKEISRDKFISLVEEEEGLMWREFSTGDHGVYAQVNRSSCCRYESALYLEVIMEKHPYFLKAYIEINYNYPQIVPKFTLLLDKLPSLISTPKLPLFFINAMHPSDLQEMQKFNALNLGLTPLLKEIEEDLNNQTLECCPSDMRDYLLCYQLDILESSFELLLDYQRNNKIPTFYINQKQERRKN